MAGKPEDGTPIEAAIAEAKGAIVDSARQAPTVAGSTADAVMAALGKVTAEQCKTIEDRKQQLDELKQLLIEDMADLKTRVEANVSMQKSIEASMQSDGLLLQDLRSARARLVNQRPRE